VSNLDELGWCLSWVVLSSLYYYLHLAYKWLALSTLSLHPENLCTSTPT